jgi:hypothetical protein
MAGPALMIDDETGGAAVGIEGTDQRHPTPGGHGRAQGLKNRPVVLVGLDKFKKQFQPAAADHVIGRGILAGKIKGRAPGVTIGEAFPGLPDGLFFDQTAADGTGDAAVTADNHFGSGLPRGGAGPAGDGDEDEIFPVIQIGAYLLYELFH